MSRVSVLGRDTNYNNYYLYMHLLCSSFSFVTKAADNFSNGNNNNNTGFTRGLVPSPLPKGNFHTSYGNSFSSQRSSMLLLFPKNYQHVLCTRTNHAKEKIKTSPLFASQKCSTTLHFRSAQSS